MDVEVAAVVAAMTWAVVKLDDGNTITAVATTEPAVTSTVT